jgi:hypothetical protein
MSMNGYISDLIEETPNNLLKGTGLSPASNNLFDINRKCKCLDLDTAAIYHHLTAKLLYLAERTRPDLLTAVSFLCTRVQATNLDDWKKLGWCLTYLKHSKHEKYTLVADASWVSM